MTSFVSVPSSIIRPQSTSFLSCPPSFHRGRLSSSTSCSSPIRRARIISLSSSGNIDDNDNHEDNNEETNEQQQQQQDDMTVYRKNGRRRQGIEELPFDVSIVSPPPRYLGRFRLDPHTHCGDIVEHDGHHFEVKIVRLQYRYLQGKYRVVGKKIEVKSLARKAIEVYLERKLNQS